MAGVLGTMRMSVDTFAWPVDEWLHYNVREAVHFRTLSGWIVNLVSQRKGYVRGM